MRLQIYVPQRAANLWSPEPGYITWDAFQKRIARAAGGLTVTSGVGHWNGREGYAIEPVYIVDVLTGGNTSHPIDWPYVWGLLREYAHQLIAQGEESILIVRDNEPTLIRH